LNLREVGAMLWQLQEAKQKFSRLVQKALDDGPQVVTRHGRSVVVVVSASEWERLTGGRLDFAEFLASAPDLDALDLDRRLDLPREVEL
jgi:prevent-host-death family protein